LSSDKTEIRFHELNQESILDLWDLKREFTISTPKPSEFSLPEGLYSKKNDNLPQNSSVLFNSFFF